MPRPVTCFRCRAIVAPDPAVDVRPPYLYLERHLATECPGYTGDPWAVRLLAAIEPHIRAALDAEIIATMADDGVGAVEAGDLLTGPPR